MTTLLRFKPGVSKRTLLFVAGSFWTIGGGILLFRGISHLIEFQDHLTLRFILGGLGGIAFYLLVFSRIKKKHTRRIITLKLENPCVFSFFDFRSYFMMALMITGGITLRKMELIDPLSLYTFFITMSIPLLLSAFGFYYYGFRYNYYLSKVNKEK